MICWPLTSLLLLFLLFLCLQSLQLRGSGSSWARKTMPRRLLNSSQSWTSCWPWTARRWSGRKRPGERQNIQKNRIFIIKKSAPSVLHEYERSCARKWDVFQSTPSRSLSNLDLEYLLCGSRKQEKLPHGTEQGFRSTARANLD